MSLSNMNTAIKNKSKKKRVVRESKFFAALFGLRIYLTMDV